MCIPTSSAVTGVPFPVLQQSLSEQTTLSNLVFSRSAQWFLLWFRYLSSYVSSKQYISIIDNNIQISCTMLHWINPWTRFTPRALLAVMWNLIYVALIIVTGSKALVDGSVLTRNPYSIYHQETAVTACSLIMSFH